MKRFFQWLLQFLDLQRGAAIFVFTLLASGLVCSWMGMRSAHVYETIDLLWNPLIQIGISLTLASVVFYLLLIHHRERRVFTICFLFSCLLHILGACYCTQQVVLSNAHHRVGVVSSEHMGANVPETVNDYVWEESEGTGESVSLKDRDYTPESANDVKPELPQDSVHKELDELNRTQTTQEAELDSLLKSSREQALKHDATLPERQAPQAQTEQLKRRQSYFQPKVPQAQYDASVHPLVPLPAEIAPDEAMKTMRAPLDLSEESRNQQLDGAVSGVSEEVLGALSDSLREEEATQANLPVYTDMSQNLAVFHFEPESAPEIGLTASPTVSLESLEAMMESELQAEEAPSPEMPSVLTGVMETKLAPTASVHLS